MNKLQLRKTNRISKFLQTLSGTKAKKIKYWECWNKRFCFFVICFGVFPWISPVFCSDVLWEEKPGSENTADCYAFLKASMLTSKSKFQLIVDLGSNDNYFGSSPPPCLFQRARFIIIFNCNTTCYEPRLLFLVKAAFFLKICCLSCFILYDRKRHV